MKFKKLLLVTLTAFTAFGMAGCKKKKKDSNKSNENNSTEQEITDLKLTASEAKNYLNGIQLSTAAALGAMKGVTVDGSASLDATARADKITLDASLGTNNPYFSNISLSASARVNTTAAIDLDNSKAKAIVSESIDANSRYTLKNSVKTNSASSTGSAEAYAVKNNNKTNIYGKYDLHNDLDLLLPDEAGMMQTLGLFNNMQTKMNVGYEEYDDYDNMIDAIYGEVDDYDYNGTITGIDLDDYINDWTIFTKSGNKLIADCSNIDAFEIDEDFMDGLDDFGLTLTISKFEIETNKLNQITGIDIRASLKGTTDLEELELESWEIEEYLEFLLDGKSLEAIDYDNITPNGLLGSVVINASCSLEYNIDYSAGTITVPNDLLEVKEIDFFDLAERYGNDIKRERIWDIESPCHNMFYMGQEFLYNANNSAKNLKDFEDFLSTYSGSDYDNLVQEYNTQVQNHNQRYGAYLTESNGIYTITANDLVSLFNNSNSNYYLGSYTNPFDNASTCADGGMTITYNPSESDYRNRITASITGTRNGYRFSYNTANHEITMEKIN